MLLNFCSQTGNIFNIPLHRFNVFDMLFARSMEAWKSLNAMAPALRNKALDDFLIKLMG